MCNSFNQRVGCMAAALLTATCICLAGAAPVSTQPQGVDSQLTPDTSPPLFKFSTKDQRSRPATLSCAARISRNLFSDTVLRHALENGASLISVQILAATTEEDRGTRMYYYKAKPLKLIIAGDLSAADIRSSVNLYSGASYGNTLALGDSYALFVTKDATHLFSWAHRDDIVRIDPDDAQHPQHLGRIESQAMEVYAKTHLRRFREVTTCDSLGVQSIPQRVEDTCARFRGQKGSRCDLAQAMWKSEIGSPRDDSRPMASDVSYLPPTISLSRTQILRLLGEPNSKVGYTYKWYCGRDSPGRGGVLATTFDSQGMVRTLTYGDEPLKYWMEEEGISGQASEALPTSTHTGPSSQPISCRTIGRAVLDPAFLSGTQAKPRLDDITWDSVVAEVILQGIFSAPPRHHADAMSLIERRTYKETLPSPLTVERFDTAVYRDILVQLRNKTYCRFQYSYTERDGLMIRVVRDGGVTYIAPATQAAR